MRLNESPVRLIKKVGDWFDERLQLATPIRETMQHQVPRQAASWAYVFGSAALAVFALRQLADRRDKLALLVTEGWEHGVLL